MATPLTMEAVKESLESVKKDIESRIASANDEHKKRYEADKVELEKRIKETEEAIKLKNASHVPGMADEKKEFSISKAVFALEAKQKGNHNAFNDFNAGFEEECMKEYAKRKSATAGLGSNAGYLIPTTYSDKLIEAVIAQTPLFQMGMDTWTGLSGDVYIPKQESFHTAYSVGENETATESDLSLSMVKLSGKRLSARAKVSKSLSRQTGGNADKIVTNSIKQAMTDKLHRLLINGTGVGQESKGLLKYTGVNSYVLGTNGARFRINDIEGMKVVLDEANELNDMSKLGIIMRPKVLYGLKTERIDQYSGQPVGQGAPIGGMDIILSKAQLETLSETKFGTTTHIAANGAKGTSSTLSSVIFGDMSNIILGMWQDMEIKISDIAGDAFFGDFFWVVSNLQYDINLKRESAFVICNDAETLASNW